MGLLTELVWQAWILSGVLVVAWVLSWWRGNRTSRTWFAVLSPSLALVTFLVGYLMIMFGGSDPGGSASCAGPSPCSGGSTTLWAESLGSISELAVAVCVNGVLAFLVAVPLVVLTILIDLARTALARYGRRESVPSTEDS
ncbi:hypothetical protein ACWKSP_31535 [Micromonosporaceae bacterium Da 78-11]